jgi:hypothetical protein
VPSSADDLYRGLSKKARKNLKWQAKRLLQDYSSNVNVRCFREPGELENMAHDVEEIAKRTYHRGLGVGFIDNVEMRQHLYLEAQKGWLRTYVMYVANEPRAFWMGDLYQGIFYSNFMGYDPAFSHYSPGMFLIVRAMEGFCSHADGDDVKEVDFGFGDAQYKQVLGNREWTEASVHIFAPSVKGLGLCFLRTPPILVDKGIKALLARTQLLQRVKRIWRTRAIRQPEDKPVSSSPGEVDPGGPE